MSNKKNRTDSSFQSFEGKNTSGRHIRLTEKMYTSRAYKKLTAHAKVLYSTMKFKYHGNPNNLTFIFTYNEAVKKCRFYQKTFRRAIDNLIQYGFIEIVELNNKRMLPNKYCFSDKWIEYGTKAYPYKYNEKLRKLVKLK